MAWGQLEDTFRESRKPKRLARLLGIRKAEARGLLTGLWSWCYTNAPDGDLGDYTDDEIEEAADWDGEPGAFVAAAEDPTVRLLDRGPNGMSAHNFLKRAKSHKKAQQKAKERAEKRSREPVADVSRDSRPTVAEMSQARGDEMKRDETTRDKQASPAKAGANGHKSVEIQTVWGKYRDHHPRSPGTLKSNRKEYKLIRERLEDFTVSELCQSIDGYHKSPFHTGDNDRGQKYLGLGLILRDVEHVTKGIEIDSNDSPKALPGSWGRKLA